MSGRDLTAVLDEGLRRASLADVPPTARTQLLRFVDVLDKWNRVWNLTAIRSREAMVVRHLVDSLTLLSSLDRYLPASAKADFDLIDIGSGAGLPVLPLAIVRPQYRYLSVERTHKKARFQRQVTLELGLDSVQVSAERIENVNSSAVLVTSRAFTEPARFLHIAQRHLAPGGRALLMLGRAERMPKVLPDAWLLEDMFEASAPSEDECRHIAICRLRES